MFERIKATREALDLSQKEFGERIGVSRDVISNLEYGRVKLKDLTLHHICEVYGVNEAWLRTGEGEMFNDRSDCNARLDEALDIFRSLEPEFQECALEQLKKLAELQGKVKL